METLPQIPGVTVRRRLAIGGMGELFLVDRVTDAGATEAAVLKRLLPGADDAHRALFAREGDALAQLASPRIVRLLGRGPGWILLEHVDGVDLATLLAHRARRGRPLPLPAAWALLSGLTAALTDLHEATGPDGAPLGLVHRDVNPANVLVSRDGEVKLIDLGVVRTALTDAATVAGVKGTLAYMAPEQLHGQPAGPEADVYAAALVAYEALTGVPARPQGAGVGLAELLAARERLPAPPSNLRGKLSPAVDAALLAALAPDPARRTPSARALGEALLAAARTPPDRAALAAAVAPVCAEVDALAPAHRTLVAAAGSAAHEALPTDIPVAASGAPRRLGRARALAATLTLGAVAGVTAFVLPLDQPPVDPPPLTSTAASVDARTTDEDTPETMAPDVPAATAPDASPETSAQTADTAPPVVGDVAPAGDTPTSSTSEDVERRRDAAAEPVDATAARRRDTRAVIARPQPTPIALRIGTGARGSVYVAGAGTRGATPQTTSAISVDETVTVTVERQLRAAVTRRGDQLWVRFSSADKTLYVNCGGGRAHLVDTDAWSVPPAGLRCEAQGRDARVLAFDLDPVAP